MLGRYIFSNVISICALITIISQGYVLTHFTANSRHGDSSSPALSQQALEELQTILDFNQRQSRTGSSSQIPTSTNTSYRVDSFDAMDPQGYNPGFGRSGSLPNQTNVPSSPSALDVLGFGSIKAQAQSNDPYLQGFDKGDIHLPWAKDETWVLTSGYGDVIYDDNGNVIGSHTEEFHYLLNMARNGITYNQPVLAMTNGIVVAFSNNCDKTSGSTCNDGWGNFVVMQVSDSKYISYSHMSLVNVTLGQKIPRGQEIGRVGSTGISTGAHLQFALSNKSFYTNGTFTYDGFQTEPFPVTQGTFKYGDEAETPISTFDKPEQSLFTSANSLNVDEDGDDISNLTDNCPFVANQGQEDTDKLPGFEGRPAGDACDRDNDGWEDTVGVNGQGGGDNCSPPQANWTGLGKAEFFTNPGQEDGNGNGIGNQCDIVDCQNPPTSGPAEIIKWLCMPDWDNDDVPNLQDNCPFVPNNNQADLNGNGKGDACDPETQISRSAYNPKGAYYRAMGYDIPMGTVGDPVNTSNGNFFHTEIDLSLPGPGLVHGGIEPELEIPTKGLELSRTYNSVDSRDSVLGKGWNLDLITYIDFHQDQLTKLPQFSVNLAGGNSDLFDKQSNNCPKNNADPSCYTFSVASDSTGTTAQLTYIPSSEFTSDKLDWAQSCKVPAQNNDLSTSYKDFYEKYPIWRQEINQPKSQNSPNLVGDTLIIPPQETKTEDIIYPDCFNFLYTDKFGNQTIFHWDTATDLDPKNDWKAGLPILIKNTDGQTIYFEFEKDAKSDQKDPKKSFVFLKAIHNNFGQKLSFSFSGQKLSKVEDNLGRNIEFNYDFDGKLITVSKPAANLEPGHASTKYTYSNNGLLTSVIDPTGRAFINNIYDSQNRVVEQQDAKGQSYQIIYSDFNQGFSPKTTTVLRNGSQVEHYYDTQGRLIKEVDQLGASKEYSYKANSFAKTTEKDELGRVTTYQYDINDNPIRIESPEQVVVENQFNAFSKLIQKKQYSSNNPQEIRQIDLIYQDQRLTEKKYPGESNKGFNWKENVLEDLKPTLDPSNQQLPEKLKPEAKNQNFAQFYQLSGFTGANDQQNTFGYNPKNFVETITNPQGGQTKLEYDAAGRIIAKTSPSGGTTQMKLDNQDNVSQITNSAGGKTTYTYLDNGLLESKKDAAGLVEVFKYDPNKKLILSRQCLSDTTVENCLQKPAYTALYDYTNKQGIGYYPTVNIKDWSNQKFGDQDYQDIRFEYDKEDNLVKKIDKEGKITRYIVDDKGNTVQIINPDESSVKMEYDAASNLIRKEDELGRTTVTEFDGLNRPSRVTRPDQRNQTFRYNAFGNIMETRDFDGKVSKFKYDLRDNLLETTDKLGRKTSFAYDQSNRMIQSQDAAGYVTKVEYSALDLPSRIQFPNGLVEKTSFNGAGLVIAKESFDATKDNQQLKIEKFNYDPAGNLIEIQNSIGGKTEFRYDPAFRKTEVSDFSSPDAKVGTTKYVYDKLSRIIETIDPLGFSQKTEYSLDGQVLSVTDKNGNTSYNHYDIRDNLIKTTNPKNLSKFFSYNLDNTLSCQTSYKNYETAFLPGKENNYLVVSEKGLETPLYRYQFAKIPENHRVLYGKETECFEYDVLRRPVKHLDFLGQTKVMEYDVNSNLIRLVNPKGQTTKYQYDAIGNLTQLTDTAGNLSTIVYDQLNRPVRSANNKNQTTSQIYDAMGSVIATIYPRAVDGANISLETILNSYPSGTNTAVDLEGLKNQGYSIDRANYNALSYPTQTTDPNGQVTNLEFNPLGQILKSIDPKGHQTTYRYDGLGRLLEQTLPSNSGSNRYTYDARSMVTQWISNTQSINSFDYDGNGNLIKKVSPLGNQIETIFDSLNLPIAIKDSISKAKELNSPKTTGLQYLQDSNQEGLISRMEYDPNSRLISRKDSLGFEVNYRYDPLGRVLSQIQDDLDETKLSDYQFASSQPVTANNRVSVDYRYDQLGNLLGMKNQIGDETTFEYNTQNFLIKTNLPNSSTTKFELDSLGNTVAVTDGLNRTTRYVLDNLNRRLETKNPKGNSFFTTYDLAGNILKETDFNGNQTTYEYVKHGSYLPTKVTDALGFSQSFGYDGLGRTISQTDKNGNQTTINFDDLSRTETITYPQNLVETFIYNPEGSLQKLVKANQATYSYDYDLRGRLKTQQNPDGGTTNYLYNPLDKLTQITKPEGGKIITGYGVRGETLLEEQSDGEIEYFQYDPKLRLNKRILPTTKAGNSLNDQAVSESYSYDSLDNVVSFVDSLNNSKTYNYDAASNLTSSKDRTGAVTEFRYDALDNLIETKNALGGSTKQNYDPNSNLTEILDAKGNKTQFIYGKRNELQVRLDGLGRKQEFTYDANGNETTWIKADGVKRNQVFDALNRLTKRTYLKNDDTVIQPGTIEFGYNQIGNLTNAKQVYPDKSTFSYQFQYDPMGRMTSQVQISSTNLYDKNPAARFAYDKESRLTAENIGFVENGSFESQNRNQYQFTQGGKVSSYINQDKDGNQLTKSSWTYSSFGLPLERTDNGKVSEEYRYDQHGRVLDWKLPGNTGFTDRQYDKEQRVVAQNNQALGTESWNLDPLGRITQYSAQKPGITETYAYDQVGNRTKQTIQKAGQTTNVSNTFDAANQMVTSTTGNTAVNYSYDANGNQIKSQSANTVLAQNIYDGENSLIESIDLTSKTKMTAKYDYLHRQIGKILSLTDDSISPNDPGSSSSSSTTSSQSQSSEESISSSNQSESSTSSSESSQTSSDNSVTSSIQSSSTTSSVNSSQAPSSQAVSSQTSSSSNSNSQSSTISQPSSEISSSNSSTNSQRSSFGSIRSMRSEEAVQTTSQQSSSTNTIQPLSAQNSAVQAQAVQTNTSKPKYTVTQASSLGIQPPKISISTSKFSSSKASIPGQSSSSSSSSTGKNLGITPAQVKVSPVLECVWDNGATAKPGERYLALFGYNNASASTVTIQKGSTNRFNPLPLDRGQPAQFEPGRKTGIFVVAFDGNNLVWNLSGKTATASRTSKACLTKPGEPAKEKVEVVMSSDVQDVLYRQFSFDPILSRSTLLGNPINKQPGTTPAGPGNQSNQVSPNASSLAKKIVNPSKLTRPGTQIEDGVSNQDISNTSSSLNSPSSTQVQLGLDPSDLRGTTGGEPKDDRVVSSPAQPTNPTLASPTNYTYSLDRIQVNSFDPVGRRLLGQNLETGVLMGKIPNDPSNPTGSSTIKPINPLAKPVFGTYQTHLDPLHGLLAVTDTSGLVIGQNTFDSFGKTIEKKISETGKAYQPVLSFGFSGALNQPENTGLGLGTKYTIEGSTIKNSTLEGWRPKDDGVDQTSETSTNLNFGRRYYNPNQGTFNQVDPVANGVEYDPGNWMGGGGGSGQLVGTYHYGGNTGNSSNSFNPEYQLANQSPVGAKDWDGYCLFGWMGTDCGKQEQARTQIQQVNTDNERLQRQANDAANRQAELERRAQNIKDHVSSEGAKITKAWDDVKSQEARLNEAVSSGEYLIRNVYVPSYAEYFVSPEKLSNDVLETQISFAGICKTDTSYPYGCNQYHSLVAENYDTSVSPNVAGFSQFQRENTRVWYTLDEARLNADIAQLQSAAGSVLSQKESLDSYVTGKSNQLLYDYGNLKMEFEGIQTQFDKNLGVLKDAGEVIKEGQQWNEMLTMGAGIAAGFVVGGLCTAGTLGVGVVGCAAIGVAVGTVIAGIGSANGEFIAHGGDTSSWDWGKIGMDTAVGAITGVIGEIGGAIVGAGIKMVAGSVGKGVIGGAVKGIVDGVGDFVGNGLDDLARIGGKLAGGVDNILLSGAKQLDAIGNGLNKVSKGVGDFLVPNPAYVGGEYGGGLVNEVVEGTGFQGLYQGAKEKIVMSVGGNADTLKPGNYANGSIPARGPTRNFTKDERRLINDLGENFGCHTCGKKIPGTKSGNFIPDHQPANALNTGGGSQNLFPHCKACSQRQAGQVTQTLNQLKKKP